MSVVNLWVFRPASLFSHCRDLLISQWGTTRIFQVSVETWPPSVFRGLGNSVRDFSDGGFVVFHHTDTHIYILSCALSIHNKQLTGFSLKFSGQILSWQEIFFGELVVLAFSVLAGIAGVQLIFLGSQCAGRAGRYVDYTFYLIFTFPICAIGSSVAWIILQYRGLAFFYAGYVIFCIFGPLR